MKRTPETQGSLDRLKRLADGEESDTVYQDMAPTHEARVASFRWDVQRVLTYVAGLEENLRRTRGDRNPNLARAGISASLEAPERFRARMMGEFPAGKPEGVGDYPQDLRDMNVWEWLMRRGVAYTAKASEPAPKDGVYWVTFHEDDLKKLFQEARTASTYAIRYEKALVAAFPEKLVDGSAPAMDGTRPEIMSQVIQCDRADRQARIEELEGKLNQVRDILNVIDVEG